MEHRPFHRPITSFVRREGRITPAQQRALAQYSSIYCIPLNEKLSFETLFPRRQAIILEIGFGNGETLSKQALAHPEYNFIGIEVHRPGVGSLLQSIEKNQLTNIKIIHGDAVLALQHQIPDDSISRFQIFFPDPWPKKRHHKRRLIQTDFVQLLSQKSKLGGEIHIATDWEAYATHCDHIFSGFPNWVKLSETRARSETKFERRGIKLGHGIDDLVYQKMS